MKPALQQVQIIEQEEHRHTEVEERGGSQREAPLRWVPDRPHYEHAAFCRGLVARPRGVLFENSIVCLVVFVCCCFCLPLFPV